MSVLVNKSGAVQRIAINRPERRNALNASVVQGIMDGIRAAQADADIRVIVLTGSGDKAFCAGGDLAPAADGAPFTVDPAHPQNPVVELFKLMEQCDLPIVARVNGHALPGGFGLLCACDIAIAADAASFGVPESKIGLFPMMIMPYMLRVLPLRRFMEMCMTGEFIDAARAVEWGIVNEAVPADRLDARVDEFTAMLAQRSPSAIRLGKQGFHAMRDMAVVQALEYAQLMLPMMARTEDAKEGMRAFQEKRAPNFTGN